MNALVQQQSHAVSDPSRDEEEVIEVLQNSLYPGAKRESIALVLSYCRVNNIDPFLKPVHIVPTNVKVGNQWEMRDVLMPGIADYRIKAARSGEYGGKSEPEFGPDVTTTLGGVKVTFPAWCKITVRRIVQGQARDFPAQEHWLENYATNKRDSDAPNRMWLKRPYGQLQKCTEAQALRMAFPEFSAGYTAEEMEGKTMFSGPTIDAEPTAAAIEAPAHVSRRDEINREVEILPPTQKPQPVERTDEQWKVWLTKLNAACTAVYRVDELEAIGKRGSVGDALATGPAYVKREIDAIFAEHTVRLTKPTAPAEDPLFGDDEDVEADAEEAAPAAAETPITPIFYGPVAVPKNGPKEDWGVWVNLLRDDLATVNSHSLEAWMADQRDNLTRCPPTQRLVAVAAIRSKLAGTSVQPPPWLADIVKPAPTPATQQPKTQKQIDEQWFAEWERTIDQKFPADAGEVSITAREEFDKLSVPGSETWETMMRLRKDNPALFNKAKALFDRKHDELPAGATSDE